ncbi:MAG: hypothetical protein ABFE13_11985 [Phycisphaerales bacterium]
MTDFDALEQQVGPLPKTREWKEVVLVCTGYSWSARQIAATHHMHDELLTALAKVAGRRCDSCDGREGRSHYCLIWTINTPDAHYCKDWTQERQVSPMTDRTPTEEAREAYNRARDAAIAKGRPLPFEVARLANAALAALEAENKELRGDMEEVAAFIQPGGYNEELATKVLTDPVTHAFAFVADREHKRAETAEARVKELEEHEEQTHADLGVVLGTDDTLYECARRMRDRAETAESALAASEQARREAEAERDRLQRCGTCEHSEWDGSCFECEYHPCGEDWSDEADDDVSPGGQCCFAPSRWAPFADPSRLPAETQEVDDG